MAISLPGPSKRTLSAVEVLLTGALAAVFVLSASYKVASPDKIPDVLVKLPLTSSLGHAYLRAISGALIGLEAYIAFAIAFRFTVKVALVASICLPLLFALAVAPFYERLGGDCGCLWKWVPFAPESGLQLIVRNVLLASTAAWLFSRYRARELEKRWKRTPSSHL